MPTIRYRTVDEKRKLIDLIETLFLEKHPRSHVEVWMDACRRTDQIADNKAGYQYCRHITLELIKRGIIPREWLLTTRKGRGPDKVKRKERRPSIVIVPEGVKNNVAYGPAPAMPTMPTKPTMPTFPGPDAAPCPVPFSLGQPDSITVWRDYRPVINVPGAEGLSATFPEGSKPAPVRASALRKLPGHGRKLPSTSESAG